ncbi:MAG: ABC transporter ATP-binding protein [Bacillota bacterium]|nr:ABC transporter ATP-binding protein [Bacillota bacterium]
MQDKVQKGPEKAFWIVYKTLQYFYPIAWKRYKAFFGVGIVKVIIYAVLPFVKIMMMPLIIDELLGARNFHRLVLYAAILVAGHTLLSLCGSFADVTLEKYQEKMDNFFSEEMGRRVMTLDFQLTEDKKALDQIEAARTGMEWYSGGVYGISMELFQGISNIITGAGVIFLIALYAPILFELNIALLIVSAIINSRNNAIEIETYGRMAKINRIFSYLAFNMMDFRYGKDIRLYHAKEMMVEKWEAYSNECRQYWKWQADKKLPLGIFKSISESVRGFGSYLYLGILTIMGKITVGTFSQMISAGNTFQYSLEGLIRNMQEIIKRSSYAYEYVKFMEYPAAIEKGERPVEDKTHTIVFRNVSFAYPGSNTSVLNDVNIQLNPGEHLSVVGLNGAGKTTFIKLLCRLYDPTEGEILLDDVNIKEYDYNQYMALFSPVFQDFKLFGFSIKENIVLDKNYSEEEVSGLIGQVGLSDKINSLLKGTDTILFKASDENGIEPSGGEQQKLAIARALFKKAPVVILDEPTAALDPVAEYDIYSHFDTLVGGKTAIYISHRLSSCRFCDKIAVFSEGRIKEYGTHNELIGIDGGIYAGMFAAQAQYYQ